MACTCEHQDHSQALDDLPGVAPPPYSVESEGNNTAETVGEAFVAHHDLGSRVGTSEPSYKSKSSSAWSKLVSKGSRVFVSRPEQDQKDSRGPIMEQDPAPKTALGSSKPLKPSSKPSKQRAKSSRPQSRPTTFAEAMTFAFAASSYSYTTTPPLGPLLLERDLYITHLQRAAVPPIHPVLTQRATKLERDFAALREALSYNPAPSPLPILERDEVLAAQTALIQRELALDAKGEVRTRKAVVGPGKSWSGRALHELQPVDLGKLQCDEWATGKVLVCRVASRCARTVAVHLVVEDCSGRLAPVHLHHLPPRGSQQLDDDFALGHHFAIKEPNVRSSRDGFVVRVESPADIVRLYPSSPLLANISFPPPRRLPVIRRTPVQYKDEGNRLFGQRRFAGARDAYSLALDGLATHDDPLHVTLLANRAAVLLKLNLPGATLADCTLALTLGPSPSLHVKLLYRAATASYTLQSFADAAKHLVKLLELAPDDLEASDLYRRTQVRLVEAARGEYDWPFLFARAAQVDALDVADYEGDMIEVKTIEGKGRGIVAKRAIAPGELIMVQKPLAMGLGDPKRKSYVVGANLYTNTMDPYALGDLVALLAEKMGDDERTRRRVLDMYAGEEKDLDPVVSSTSPGIDISRLQAVATFNSFHTESLAQKTASLSPSDEAAQNIHAPSSLYALPSMLNHSCLGNVSYSFLADTFFLRARLPIAAGEELLDSYVDSLEGLEQRADKLDKHRFVCDCRLCGWDRQDGAEARRERERLAGELEQLTDRIHGPEAQDPAPLLEEIRGYVGRIEGTYGSKRPSLRPALYPALRLLAATLGTMGRSEEAIEVERRALRALGAEVEGEGEGAKLIEVPRVGDVNGVLSCLFIALQYKRLERAEASRAWVAIARRIERGQAGEAVFEARYAGWASKNGLKLREDDLQ